MKRFAMTILVMSVSLLAVEMRPVHAHYDDVHYHLNYYIARLVGYTPEQAKRLAGACVSVDYSEEVEPVQLGGRTIQAMLNNELLTARILGPQAARLLLQTGRFFCLRDPSIDPAVSREEFFRSLDGAEQLPFAVEKVAKAQEFQDVLDAQWRFHAFRDTFTFPPQPNERMDSALWEASRKKIVLQRDLLFREGRERLKNPGVFLHFFQDEVPHAGYFTGGGHWILMPGQRLDMGGTTDWFSFRDPISNLSLVRQTADYLIRFMRESSKHQKPLRTSSEVVAVVESVLHRLREVNAAPRPLADVREVLYSKWLMYSHGNKMKGSAEEEARYAKHADGPDLKATADVLNAAMKAADMEPIPPEPIKFEIKKLPINDSINPSSGAYITNVPGSVLFGNLIVRINDPTIKDEKNLPRKVEVIVWSVPTQKQETEYELNKIVATLPSREVLSGGSDYFAFFDEGLPVGVLSVEVRYDDKTVARQKVLLDTGKKTETIVIAPRQSGDKIEYRGLVMQFSSRLWRPGEVVRDKTYMTTTTNLESKAILTINPKDKTVTGEVLYMHQFDSGKLSNPLPKFYRVRLELQGRLVVPVEELMQPARGKVVLRGKYRFTQTRDERRTEGENEFMGVLFFGKGLAVPGYPEFNEYFLALYTVDKTINLEREVERLLGSGPAITSLLEAVLAPTNAGRIGQGSSGLQGGGESRPDIAPGSGNFDGVWQTAFGTLRTRITLRQSGNRVTGTYTWADGKIEGTVTGNVLRFKWTQSNGRKGAGHFILKPDGKSFEGYWSYTDDPDNKSGGSWNGTRQ